MIYDSMILYDRYMIAPDQLASSFFLFFLLLDKNNCVCLLTWEFFTDAVI